MPHVIAFSAWNKSLQNTRVPLSSIRQQSGQDKWKTGTGVHSESLVLLSKVAVITRRDGAILRNIVHYLRFSSSSHSSVVGQARWHTFCHNAVAEQQK